MSNSKNQVSDNVAIERERQKTKRYLMFLVSFVTIAIIGIVMVLNKAGDGGTGGIELDLSKGKISVQLQKPIVKQTKQPTVDYKSAQGDVEYTTGKIDSEVIRELENNDVDISLTSFAGENYINTELGFIITVLTPSAWTVHYNPDGEINPLVPVNTIVTNDAVSSHLNVNLEILPEGMNFKDNIMMQLNGLVSSGLIAELPDISYDKASETIFLSYLNRETNGATYQKVVLDGDEMYFATANYNTEYTPAERINDLIEMVASFTLISS